MIAFVFPGQGARDVQRGLSFLPPRPALTANGGRALERTDVLQPVLTEICLAVHRRLRDAGVRPGLVLGHSLGELSAWAAAGALADDDALALASTRGALMADAAAQNPGGLVALPSLEAATEAVRARDVELAAHNAPDEVVVTGGDAQLAGLKGHRVPVSGAWHGRLMRAAVEPFRAALAAIIPTPRRALLVQNRDGALADDALTTLADQLTRPVQFSASLATARAHGVDTFVTVGPGHVLRGLIRRNLGTDVRVLTTEDEPDLNRTIHALRERA